jgi:hypothetical protein
LVATAGTATASRLELHTAFSELLPGVGSGRDLLRIASVLQGFGAMAILGEIACLSAAIGQGFLETRCRPSRSL